MPLVSLGEVVAAGTVAGRPEIVVGGLGGEMTVWRVAGLGLAIGPPPGQAGVGAIYGGGRQECVVGIVKDRAVDDDLHRKPRPYV